MGYKRVDLVVETFKSLGWQLLVIGDGPEKNALQSQASDNIEFLGYVSDLVRTQLMARAKAVIVTALEDYGLVPIEANASGTPVIAYGAGGVLDTQISGATGLFFEEQTSASLQAALLKAKSIKWDYSKIRDRAINHFSEEVFFKKIDGVFNKVLSQRLESSLFAPIPK